MSYFCKTMQTLFLSYDGLTDPLGQSQILPYQEGIAAAGHGVTIISTEKDTSFIKRKDEIQMRIDKADIHWKPIRYTKQPPIVSTILDVWKMKRLAFQLHKERKFDLVHCRSYLTMLVGAALKRKFGVKLIFDLRGFWADERVDGGLWPQGNPLYRMVYKYFKRKEALWMATADRIVSLTEAGAKVMRVWPAFQQNPNMAPKQRDIEVIPCAADFDFFSLVTSEDRTRGRKYLGISEDALVVNYLGSIGTWYLLPEMFKFFKGVLMKRPDAIFLFLTPEPTESIVSKAAEHGIGPEKVIVRYAERNEINTLLSASDVSLCFIKPCFSKLSSSPTKIGELLAKGIPIVANAGVGDVEQILSMVNAGIVLKDFEKDSISAAVDSLLDLLKSRPSQNILREKSKKYFGLKIGIDAYLKLYNSLDTNFSEALPN